MRPPCSPFLPCGGRPRPSPPTPGRLRCSVQSTLRRCPDQGTLPRPGLPYPAQARGSLQHLPFSCIDNGIDGALWGLPRVVIRSSRRPFSAHWGGRKDNPPWAFRPKCPRRSAASFRPDRARHGAATAGSAAFRRGLGVSPDHVAQRGTQGRAPADRVTWRLSQHEVQVDATDLVWIRWW